MTKLDDLPGRRHSNRHENNRERPRKIELRMSTRYKIRSQNALSFFTCVIVGWVDLFTRQVYRDMVLDSWRYCQKHKGFRVHAYVFMSNHLHLIASCEAPYRLENIMRDWKAFTARQIIDHLLSDPKTESRREWLLYLFSYFAANKKKKQTYQVWQHDNHPIELYTDSVIVQKMNYIHLNPVKAGLVEAPEDWLYSSASYYVANDKNMLKHIQPLINIDFL